MLDEQTADKPTLANASTQPVDPLAELRKKVAITPLASQEQGTDKSLVDNYAFDPSNSYYEKIDAPTPFTTNVDEQSRLKQGKLEVMERLAKNFGTNFITSVGQGLADTFDLVSAAKSTKAVLGGGDTDFNSGLFGLSSKEMQDWAQSVQDNNKIYEKNPGSFSPSDPAWWANQTASAGTGIGMAVDAVVTTAAIEYLTGGTGTGAALTKLGSLFSKVRKGVEGTEALAEAISATKGLRSAATLYGTISRLAESKMEARNDYSEIMTNLSAQKKADGTPKYSQQEMEHMASEGSKVDYAWNLALLPLDILSYRTMVFNPISGTGEGLVEKGLEKVAGIYGKSKLGKAAGWATTHALGLQLEGMEEGFQAVGESEGIHYANVLAGLDDKKNFLQRFGEEVTSDDFWNNYAGGVIGGPVIGGMMNLSNKISGKNNAKQLDQLHKNYLSQVGAMDAAYANQIQTYEKAGKTREAAILRRQFSANKALSALHLDALTDKDTAFDARTTFIQGTLDELNNGKFDSLKDLGFNNPSTDQIDTVKKEFATYLEDANKMKEIYDNVKDKYNRNFVPTITQAHFNIHALQQELGDTNNTILEEKAKLAHYTQLTPQGQQLHDNEYHVQNLKLELARLRQLSVKTTDEAEKANVQALISQTDAKIDDAQNTIKEINANTEYSREQRESDADIIGSALMSKEYHQALYDKLQVENTISLERKNLALWNKKEYQEEKVKQSVKNAKTQQQVDDAKKAAPASTTVQKAADDKAAEIASNDLAAAMPNAKAESVLIPGNSSLDDDDFKQTEASANDIAEVVKFSPEDGIAGAVEHSMVLFDPANFDMANSSEEAKNKVVNSVKNIQVRLPKDSTFEDLVRHIVKVKGLDATDNIFHAISYGWEHAGNAKDDYAAVYSRIFGNPEDDLMRAASQLSVVTPEQLQNETTKIGEAIIAAEQKPEGFDNGQPAYVYPQKGSVTNEVQPKGAFSTRLSKEIIEEDEDGNKVVSHEYSEDSLNANKQWIDPDINLDPDAMNEGQATTIRIPDNFADVPISVFNPDGSYASTMTFGQYVAMKDLTPDMQEYKDKLPMIHYIKEQKLGVMFVHDTQWYHPLRFNIAFKGDMDKVIASTREIRDEVIANHAQGKGTPATITGKRQTTFAGLKTAKTADGKYVQVSLREANPQTELTVALSTDSLSTSKGTAVRFPNGQTKLINKTPFHIGDVYEVRRFGLEQGTKTFVANPVTNQLLNEDAQSSVVQAITLYGNRDRLNDTQKATVKSIEQTMGMDILSPVGLEQYLAHFINIRSVKVKTNSGENLTEKVADAAAVQLAHGTPYINIEKGHVIFGFAGALPYAGAKTKAFFINPSASYIHQATLDALAKPKMIGWFRHNVDVDRLAQNKPIVHIAKNGNTTTAAPSYNDYLLDNITTNIRSYNIGTEDKPNWVTNVQPIITYDTNSRLAKANAPVSMEESAKEILPVAPTVEQVKAEEAKIDAPDDAKAAMAAFLAQAAERFGNDAGISQDVSFDPAEMTETERMIVTQSLVRIAGLLPHQQSQVVDFLFNKIVPLVDANKGQVTEKQVEAVIAEAVDKVFNPLVVSHKSNLELAEKLLTDFPDFAASNPRSLDYIALYKKELAQVRAITDNLGQFKVLAKMKLDKYTNIKSGRVLESETNEGDEDEANVIDFWTDVLTENPENKATYKMRRFFGQIPATDKNGKPIKGVLGLDTYVESNRVIKSLMTSLADVPAKLETMLDRLEERKAGIPWMEEAIAKIKTADKQMQKAFVTVMSNTQLRMKFTMLSYNRKSGSWTTKVFDTNVAGVADSIRNQWKNNFLSSPLVTLDNDGDYSLNKAKAEAMIHMFDGWKGKNLRVVKNIGDVREQIVGHVKLGESVIIQPKGELLQELKTNLVSYSDKMSFNMATHEYQVTLAGNNKFKISYLAQDVSGKEHKEQVRGWLKDFGIVMTDEAFNELTTKGMRHNYANRSYSSLFEDGTNTGGLFGILTNELRLMVNSTAPVDFTENGGSPLDNSVINSLANLEANYNESITPFGFRDNGKAFFGLTAPKFITDRARDLKDKNSDIIDQLKQVSFSQGSFWLRLLEDDTFKSKFAVTHMGDTAFKEQGKKIYKDNSLTSLSDADHELTKKGMFEDMHQGEVRVGGLKTYPGSTIEMRMATMFSPTMSDKHIMTLITTAVLKLQTADLNHPDGISDAVAKVLYNETVRPELLRMIKFAQNGSQTDISSYDEGAGMFLLMPEMNNLELTPGLKLIDAIKYNPNKFTAQQLETNDELMKDIYTTMKQYVKTLVDEKVEVWSKDGFMERGETGEITKLKFFNNEYISRFRGNAEQQARMAATDFVVNSLITNANSFMVFAGDPALFYKEASRTDEKGNKRENTYLEKAQDTFVNAGKRLAMQIAPGTTLADSEDEKYLQVFLQDRKSVAGNMEYLEKLYGKEGAKAYRKLDATDAQEYTTWKEHLNILEKLGKMPDNLTDVTAEEIAEAREVLSSGKDLNARQAELIGKVMQPMKPVYTGQILDKNQDVMRTMYIKSSSFPLIPQLTAGLEIDKLRKKLEALEEKHQMPVRASYQSANKVGAIKIAKEDTLFNDEGDIKQEIMDDFSDKYSKVLDRKNFRIQQEVPFKSGKIGQDKVTLGTQLMKLLFGDGMMTLKGFKYNGKTYTGHELQREYNDVFIKLINEKQQQLFTELGLDSNGNSSNITKTTAKLQAILRDEAIKRDYPLQDIEGLTLDENGNFNLPLWSSANSNRYESMLNAIVTNRMIRLKMPGNSYVAGSEEGFKFSSDLEGQDKSKIIWTSAWNGKNITATYHADGQIKKAQVLVASKFKDASGKLIDLFEGTGTDRKYVKKTEAGWKLKEGMFDKELLSLISFRIPTSGHQSASQIEIAGFLPFESADLMIVPKNFTKQKGLDFDIDKENTYQLNHVVGEDGKIEVLAEKHRTQILAEAEKLKVDEGIRKLQYEYKEAVGPLAKKLVLKKLSEQTAYKNLIDTIGGDYTVDIEGTLNKATATFDKTLDEDLLSNLGLEKVNNKFNEALMQNEIVKIHHSVLGNESNEVQSKIAKTLNTDFAEEQAELIERLSNTNKDEKHWTPLSDEYQKQKMMSGASGKIGTGAYSIDVVFHSLAQQAALNGNPIKLLTKNGDETYGIDWRFGKVKTDGVLGNIETLDGGRSISEVQAERQNIAVDNEKLQVMARVGLNELTMDVDKVFNMLGFDKGEDGNSISFLFLSQPIIKAYVDRLRNANSNIAEFESNKEDKLVEALIKEYYPTEETIDDAYWNSMSDKMTNASFIEAIKSKEPDGQLQAAVLRRFIQMKKFGIAIRGVQTSINVDSKGLGKSFFDVIEKKNALNRLGSATEIKQDGKIVGAITGASTLIGDYREIPSDVEELRRYMDDGYINIGMYMVKPDTLSGAFNVNGVMTAYNMWSRYFPYDAKITQQAFNETLSIIGTEDMGDLKTIELKQEIFRGMKKYFSASKYNGIIKDTDDINAERQRLYIDSDTNTSLPAYLRAITRMMGEPVIDTFIKTNKLINRFEYSIQRDGQPSLIKFNNAAGEDFDEQYLYEALTTLMAVQGKTGSIQLPTVGNKTYSLHTLAQDLIAYSFLGNATQEAIQFTKYVPISYLLQRGYADKMKTAGMWLRESPGILGMTIGKDELTQKHMVSEFTMQYVQHNPEKVKGPYKDGKKLMANIIEGNSTKLTNLTSFKLKTQDKPTFISVYNPEIPKGEKKFQLYWYNGERYQKVDVLGTFGMDEYQPRNTIGDSLVNGRVRTAVKTAVDTRGSQYVKDAADPFSIKGGNITDVVTKIADANLGIYSELAKKLLPYAAGIKIQYAEAVGNSSGFNGLYTHETNDIYINPINVSPLDANKTARVVMHELVHALTVNQVKDFLITNDEGDVSVTSTAPSYVTDLVRLFNAVRDISDKTELKAILARVNDGGSITEKERHEKYGLTNIYEFMSMALTQPEFQKYLAQEKFKQSGKSLLDKFKEIISSIFSALGVTFESDTATAQAINSIFATIEATNESVYTQHEVDYQQRLLDEDREFEERMNKWNGEMGGGEVEFGIQLDPNTFPNKQLDIKEEKCI